VSNAPDGPSVVAALLRLLLLAIVLIATELVGPSRITGMFAPAFVLACSYAVGALVASFTHRGTRWLSRLGLAPDLIILCVLDLTSGGPYSQIRFFFFVLPLLAAATLRPGQTAIWGLLALAGFLLVALATSGTGNSADQQFVFAQILLLVWTSATATLLAWLFATRERRITGLADDRRRLFAQLLDAAQRERKRLAYRLHDEPLQNILAALWELYAMEPKDRVHHDAAVHALEGTLVQLRDTIFELQPLTLDQAGLRVAIKQLAEHHASRGGIKIDVSFDPRAVATHDQLVYEVVRELLTNATLHAEATAVEVTVERQENELIVEVADDGQGIPEGRLDKALAEGHLGLAATADRAHVLDGKFVIDTAVKRGTIVRVILPCPPEAAIDTASALTSTPISAERPVSTAC
jgi:two-component system, NarL family, sensor kinase